ncbi:MAG: MFS transporter, partial [Promethearchaeota archaeon]
MNLEQEKNSEDAKKYSIWILISVGFGQFMIDFLEMVFNSRLFDFYENEIGLATQIISLALIIYAIWNMFNDPIVGYIADRPRKFWKRWGKRFPWIVGSGIPWALFFIVLFAVPNWDPEKDKWLLFTWLLLSICIYDTLFSTFDGNYNSVIPDKFRSDKNRLRQSSFANILSLIGAIVASMVPPNIIEYNNKPTFLKMAVIVSLIGLASLFILLPGVYENKSMRERAVLVDSKVEQVPFFTMVKKALKQKTFVAFIIVFTAYQACNTLITGSIPYVVRFIIKGDPEAEMYIMLGYVLFGVIFIPIWTKLAQKYGNRRIFILCGILIAISAIPLIFVTTLIQVIITSAIMGIGLIGFAVLLLPILADIIDEASVLHKKRQGSFYMGLRIFFARTSYIFQSLTFALVHIFTGFQPGSKTQTP